MYTDFRPEWTEVASGMKNQWPNGMVEAMPFKTCAAACYFFRLRTSRTKLTTPFSSRMP